MWREVRGYPLVAFAVCLAAYATSQMDLALFGYALPAIRAEFGLSLSGVSAIVSSAFVLAGVLIVWFALLADRLGRKQLFVFSLVASSVLVALHSLIFSIILLAVIRGSSIAAGGLTYPLTGSIIAEEFPARYRGLFLGFLQVGYPLGWALASFWSILLLERFGWRALFLVGLVSLPLVWVVYRLIREPQRSLVARANSVDKVRIAELFSPPLRKRTVLLFVAQFLFVFAYAASIFLFPLYLSDHRGFTSFDFSLLIGVGNTIAICGYLLAAYTGEFLLTRRTTVVIWTLLGALLFQVLVWFTTTFAEMLIVYGLMSMFFYGSAAVKFAYLAEVFPTRVRATAMSTSGSLAVTLGSAAGPYTVARMIEMTNWNFGYATFVGSALALAGLLYLFLTPIPSGLEVEEVEAMLAGGRTGERDSAKGKPNVGV